MSSGKYLLENHHTQAAMRFEAISRLFDATTHRCLLETGLARGWRCWEVGAGDATIAKWIAEIVGDAGLASEDEIENGLANLRAGSLDITTAPLISAKGRKMIEAAK